jgi:hypothetical protein
MLHIFRANVQYTQDLIPTYCTIFVFTIAAPTSFGHLQGTTSLSGSYIVKGTLLYISGRLNTPVLVYTQLKMLKSLVN